MNYELIAEEYLSYGLLPVPVSQTKEPMKGCMWKTWGYDKIMPFFKDAWGIAIRTDDIEVIDIDNKLGNAHEILTLIRNKFTFIDKCTIARSQSYGYHIFYSFQSEGNKKLAYQKNIYGDWEGVLETRGKGGFIVIAPSKGYEFIHNDIHSVNNLTALERDALFKYCRRMNQRPIKKETLPDMNFSDRSIIQEAKSLLKQNGWRFSGRHVTRPGKKEGTSATFGIVGEGVFYVFSANGGVFEPDRSYSSFQVIGKLMFNDDFKATAKYCKEKFG